MTWADFLGGLAAGVAAIVVWSAATQARDWWLRRQKFAHLAGRYQIARKLTADLEPGTVSIDVRGNLLVVTVDGLPDGASVFGEIEMNERLSRTGRGHYSHTTGERQLWGFWDLQVFDEDTLFVHTTYAQFREHRAVVSGYVWTRIPDSR